MLRKFSWMLSSVLMLFIAGCPKACDKTPSKAEYIEEMDKRCTDFENTVKETTQKMQALLQTDADKGLEAYEKLINDAKRWSEELKALPRPKEDAALLEEYFTLVSPGNAVMDRLLVLHKKMISGADDPENEVELNSIQSELISIAKKSKELGGKFGFKKCGNTDTENALDTPEGELQPDIEEDASPGET